MKKLRAGVIGATGMVGQRFITLLNEHPYFELAALFASARSGVLSELRKRECYEKPSVKRKKKSEAARKRKYK